MKLKLVITAALVLAAIAFSCRQENPGTVKQRKGVGVDVEIRPTLEGIKEGKDEILEKAIQIAREE